MTQETATFPKTDAALTTIKMAIAATREAAQILARGERLAPNQPFVVPHTLFYGPAGLGKTTRVLEAVKLMGCSEEAGTFVSINADTIKSIDDFINILVKMSNWEGYRCNHGKTSHADCPKHKHLIDISEPKAPVKPFAIFIDELHLLPVELQEKLGLIMLDWKYAVMRNDEVFTYYFPKFTVFAATTIPGDLIKPLRSRFANKFRLDYYSDMQMVGIVRTMAEKRQLSICDSAVAIIARVAQGVAREAENHLRGAYNCWVYRKQEGRAVDDTVICREDVAEYLNTVHFLDDGLSFNQVKVLDVLAKNTDFRKTCSGVGVKRLCSALGMDEQQYFDEVEPRLFYRQLIQSGARGRQISSKGVEYLKNIRTSDDIIANF